MHFHDPKNVSAGKYSDNSHEMYGIGCLLNRALHVIEGFTAESIAMLMWALATLGVQPGPELMMAISRLEAIGSGEIKVNEMMNRKWKWALATLGLELVPTAPAPGQTNILATSHQESDADAVRVGSLARCGRNPSGDWRGRRRGSDDARQHECTLQSRCGEGGDACRSTTSRADLRLEPAHRGYRKDARTGGGGCFSRGRRTPIRSAPGRIRARLQFRAVDETSRFVQEQGQCFDSVNVSTACCCMAKLHRGDRERGPLDSRVAMSASLLCAQGLKVWEQFGP